MEILNIENLSFSYPSQNKKTEKKALENINLSVTDGEFIVLCGESGCGKTTLLRLIKKNLAPHGVKQGRILYSGTDTDDLDDRLSAEQIGFVMQNPDSQIVTDKVWHELAFGLENLGTDPHVIRRRVGEMASFFGIQDWFGRNTDELSGGLKQLLNLASVMVMQPKILLLDEPTAQLDPIAAEEFLAVVSKINRELGLTVIIAEHRLEELFNFADRIVLMENGKCALCSAPDRIGEELKKIKPGHRMLTGFPSSVRIYQALDAGGKCPISVKEGREYLSARFSNQISVLEKKEYSHSEEISVEMQDIWFRYEKTSPDILRGADLKIYKNELFCLLGGNGSGKTTLLNVISSVNRAYRGKVYVNGKNIHDYKYGSLYRNNLAFLPQNPQTVFLKNSVSEDLKEIFKNTQISRNQVEQKINDISEKLNISELMDKHPYDLSGGEQQKCALAKMLLTGPKILLLDEPTKGLDSYSKIILGNILKNLTIGGLTVLMVTHDLEFAAEYADRCAMFFDGSIISADTPGEFFSGNSFYTTAANRISRHMYQGAVTCGDVIDICRKNGLKTVI